MLMAPAVTILPTLIAMTKHKYLALRDTAAWVIGVIAESLPDALEPSLDEVMTCTIECLKNAPTVAVSAAWVRCNAHTEKRHRAQTEHDGRVTVLGGPLAALQTILSLSDHFDQFRDEDTPSTPMSKYYPALVTALVTAASQYVPAPPPPRFPRAAGSARRTEPRGS